MCNKPEKSALLPKRLSIGEEQPDTKSMAIEAQPLRNRTIFHFSRFCAEEDAKGRPVPASLGLPATLARPDLYENHTCELHVFGGEWSLLDRIRPIQHMRVHRSTNHGATEATQRIRPEREILCVQPKHYGKRKAFKLQSRQPNPEPRVV